MHRYTTGANVRANDLFLWVRVLPFLLSSEGLAASTWLLRSL